MSKTSVETTSTTYDLSDFYEEENRYWWSVSKRSLIKRFFRRYSTFSNPRIIDVGCGGGGLLNSLKDYGRLFALEPSPLGAAKTLAKTNAKTIRGDAEHVPLKNESFDVLTCLDVIEHLQDDKRACEELNRVLSKGGILFLTVPALNIFWSSRDELLGHRMRYTTKGIRNLLKAAGFRVIRCTYTNSFYSPGLLALALYEKMFGRKIKPKTAILSIPHGLAKLFSWILKVEENILMHIDLPIGTSILCVAKKEMNSGSQSS